MAKGLRPCAGDCDGRPFVPGRRIPPHFRLALRPTLRRPPSGDLRWPAAHRHGRAAGQCGQHRFRRRRAPSVAGDAAALSSSNSPARRFLRRAAEERRQRLAGQRPVDLQSLVLAAARHPPQRLRAPGRRFQMTQHVAREDRDRIVCPCRRRCEQPVGGFGKAAVNVVHRPGFEQRGAGDRLSLVEPKRSRPGGRARVGAENPASIGNWRPTASTEARKIPASHSAQRSGRGEEAPDRGFDIDVVPREIPAQRRQIDRRRDRRIAAASIVSSSRPRLTKSPCAGILPKTKAAMAASPYKAIGHFELPTAWSCRRPRRWAAARHGEGRRDRQSASPNDVVARLRVQGWHLPASSRRKIDQMPPAAGR